MTVIIDRRENPRDKNLGNRQRLLERHKKEIKEKIKRIVDKGGVKQSSDGQPKIRISGTAEPSFNQKPNTGDKRYVLPGNKKYVPGDQEWKQNQQNGAKGNGGSPDGEGEDDFEFVLSKEEYLQYLMDELELPDLVKKQLRDTTKFDQHRAGFKAFGTPSQLDLVRTMRNGIGRRIGLSRPKNETIAELQQELDGLDQSSERAIELLEEIERLKNRQIAVPWLDPIDVKYRNYEAIPRPITKAVMFCVMDVSGSMTENEKDLAKRFFLLLNLFLERKYKNVDVVFIAHHSRAFECNEQEFFHGRQTGGTIVSSALFLTEKIIKERYSPADWNIYVAQCSDGDNYLHDHDDVASSIDRIMKVVQYFAYLEIGSAYLTGTNYKTDLWKTYEPIAETQKLMVIRKVKQKSEIWHVFADLFAPRSKVKAG